MIPAELGQTAGRIEELLNSQQGLDMKELFNNLDNTKAPIFFALGHLINNGSIFLSKDKSGILKVHSTINIKAG